jgi:hypothetical protein
MAEHAEVFISGTTRDLGSYRREIKEALLTLKIFPIEESNFELIYGPLVAMLRDLIGRCDVVIHLAGAKLLSDPWSTRGSVSNARADQAAKELGISRSLVYRLVARHRQRAQTSSLLSVPRGRTHRSQWLDTRVETLIRSAVERIYLQREQPRVSDLLRTIKADCQRFGLKPPSYNTLHARLLSLDPREVTRRRLGAAAARQRFTPVGTSSLQPTLPWKLCRSTTLWSTWSCGNLHRLDLPDMNQIGLLEQQEERQNDERIVDDPPDRFRAL